MVGRGLVHLLLRVGCPLNVRKPIRSAVRVSARHRCSRLGRRALLLHQSCGDPDVGHGCFDLRRGVGLLETCQRCAQVGLEAVECRKPRLFELEA
jgi:hypothetical protein